MNSSGNVIWSKVLTSSTEDYNSVKVDSNGDIYTVGSTRETYSNYADALISKYNSDGDLLWTETIGGTSNNHQTDFFLDLAIDSLGNIYTVGSTKSNDGDITDGNTGYSDTLIVKFTPDGTKVWDKTFGSTSYDKYASIMIDDSDNIYAVGSVQQVDGDLSGTALGETDIVLVKLDTDGNIIWDKIYGSASYDSVADLTQNSNGNIVMIGEMDSNAFLMELDSDGVMQWQKTYNDGDSNKFNSLAIDSTGIINISGSTTATCTDQYGECSNGLLLKFDSSGTIKNRSFIGGSGYDYFYGVTTTPDGSVIAVGSTRSIDGDIPQSGNIPYNNGNSDALILKFH